MLNIIHPHALINGAVLACVSSLAIRLVVLKFTFESISIRVPETPLAMSSVILPIPSVLSSVWPDLNSISMSNAKHFVAFRLSIYWF